MRKFTKAYTGFAAGFAGSLGLALLDGDFAAKDFWGALGVGLLAAAAVYKVRNKA